jgi:hypothetical protein
VWPFRRKPNALVQQAIDPEALKGIIAAVQALQSAEPDFRFQGSAGLCLRPGKPGAKPDKGERPQATVADATTILKKAQELYERRERVAARVTQDDMGFLWIALRYSDLEPVADMMSKLVRASIDAGFGRNLLVALFRCEQQRQEVQVIFSCGSQRFYPFAPQEQQRRDTTLELALASRLENVVPVERLERWHGVWGAPLSA